MADVAPAVSRTVLAAASALRGERRGLGNFLPFLGPAFVASIAYMDPGNFATNIQAGARYGYGLLWVVVLANAIAMLFQALSAKIGIVTEANIAELCRRHFPRALVVPMWIVSELAAMATDLAEFLGGAIGLALLCRMPLPVGMVATGVATYALLALERRGFRPLELAVSGLVGVICLCYVVELAIVPPDWHAAALGSVVPHLADGQAVVLAVGIVGATVMPHAIYLHSSLTQHRIPLSGVRERRTALRFSNREVVLALGLAGLVNMAMVATASSAFHAGHADVAEITTAYHTLGPLFGAGAAGVFLVALFASGLSSSAVGTLAGQVVMQGFVGFAIPIWVRRLVTMVPAFVVVACGVDPTQALVLSQVVLSIALPVPMIALVVLGARRDVMGELRSSRPVTVLAIVACAVVLGLNALLLAQLAGVTLPGFG